MEIDEKDIIFGVIRRRDGRTMIQLHTEDKESKDTLCGALSYLAATDDSFRKVLAYAVGNAIKHGGEIRRKAAQQEKEGRLVRVNDKKIKS